MSLLGGLLWDPIKKATGLTDAQMIGIGATAVAAPYALPLLSGGAAAGAGTAGAAGAGSSLTGGLLNFSGTQAAAPIADLSMKATAADVAGMSNGSGLLSSLKGGLTTAGNYAKPIGNIAGAASQANGLIQGQQQPMVAPPLPQYQDISGLINKEPLAQLQAKRNQRRGLLGGTYG